MPNDYQPLKDYGVVGDGRTAALIAGDGSVDWLCLPRFDSPSLFGALLDARHGGYWSLRPAGSFTSRAEYLSETNVLATTFETGEAVARLTDFMPHDSPEPTLLRKLEGLAGTTIFECHFEPRPDYARRHPNLSATPTGLVGDSLCLALSATLFESDITADSAHYRIEVAPGQPAWFGLAAGDRLPDLLQGESLLVETLAFWRTWANRLHYAGPYHADVMRSTLALKLLIHEPTGAPLAAATTSLPEWIGGERNWDYRYSWVRDSSYMLGALARLGYLDETRRYLHWLREVCPAGEPLPVMFDLDGRRVIPEFTLDQLEGYRASRPVRIGNAASTQRQLDIFGALLDLVWRYHRRGGDIETDVWRWLAVQVDWVAAHWRELDSGIWEPRLPPQHHVYSKVMAWVALARGAELARDRRDEAAARWLAEAHTVRVKIEQHGWNPTLGFYPMYFGADTPDAALLRLSALGFASADDPRTAATVSAIRRWLGDGPHLQRYRLADGVRGEEGTFFLVGFWLVEALARAGERNEAERLFERLRQEHSPLGLYSEMIDPATGDLLGNFPQGFSHLGLIEAALALAAEAELDPHPTTRQG